ncbi:MAG: helix-turn-helix domain-containing protein [Rhodospirillales bacterium]|nr:helix-turn-helix domain-containing protein [Rhodospirillales bacterium]
MTTPGMISIGALAKRSGVLAETIRYYETEGLLRKPERSAGGYRLYNASDVERLSFIRQARELGFKLDAVRRLLGLADRKVNTCDEVRELAGAHLAEVRAKLADLRRMERVLSDLVRSCEGRTVPECLLLEALATPGRKATMPKAARATGTDGAKRPAGARGTRPRRRIT